MTTVLSPILHEPLNTLDLCVRILTVATLLVAIWIVWRQLKGTK